MALPQPPISTNDLYVIIVRNLSILKLCSSKQIKVILHSEIKNIGKEIRSNTVGIGNDKLPLKGI